MADYTITISDDTEKAGIALLGSSEALARELQAGIDKMTSPWVAKSIADTAKATQAEALAMKEKYAKLEKSDQAAVDEILAKEAVQAVGDEEPLIP